MARMIDLVHQQTQPSYISPSSSNSSFSLSALGRGRTGHEGDVSGKGTVGSGEGGASRYVNVMRPLFISCDPARDTPAVLKSYLAEFHPSLIGLTGTYDTVKAVCKAYRVYFSTPPEVKPGQDYLVDHSIYFYLMGMFFSFPFFSFFPPLFVSPSF